MTTSILSAKDEKSLEKTITTKDLAKALGVDVKTIQRASTKLFDINVVKSVSKGGRPTQVFSEEQATAIKIELQNHSKIAKNGFDTLSISNDLEMLVIQKKLDAYKDQRIAELEAENKKLLPDAESWRAFAEKSGNYCVTNIAKCLKLNRNKIFYYLQVKGYICRDKRSNDWIGTAKGVNLGFIANEIWTNDKKSGIQMRITPKCMQKIACAFGKTSASIEETADKIIDNEKDVVERAGKCTQKAVEHYYASIGKAE